jgi:hypothetical protein
MPKNRLSILIPSIPERFDRAYTFYQKLQNLASDKDIEILMLTDNRMRTIGAKREALKNVAHGKYFMFCDDDDEILSLDEIYEATAQDVDVIDFKAECTNPDGSAFIVTQRLGYEIEHKTENGKYLDCNRPPFPNCAWNSRFKDVEFPDISYGEDGVWVERCLEKESKGECFIDKVLFKYNFSPSATAASTESNEFWTNPNHQKVINRCIVNVSTDKYRKGQKRLATSLRNNTTAAVLLFESEEEVGAELHTDNNYAFKPRAVIKAYEAGYRQILWLDASMRAIKNIDVIFDIIERDGYFFQDSGWPNSRWTTPEAKEYFGTDEGDMLSSGVLGLDLDSEIGYKFFDQWTQAMRDGMFNGSWDDYRHDQSAASLIAFNMGLKLQPGNTFFVYGKEDEPTISEQTVLLADGVC